MDDIVARLMSWNLIFSCTTHFIKKNEPDNNMSESEEPKIEPKQESVAEPKPADLEVNGQPNGETVKTENSTSAPNGEANGESSEDKVNLAKVQAEFQEKAKAYLREQTSHIVVPSFAKWFDIDTIHPIEKKLFPDFFVENKSIYRTKEIYKNMRDFIVSTYRLNPVEYLTVTAVRKNLAGDVATIIRVHQFLEKWGLINYQVDPRSKSSIVGPQYTGHFQITLDTPSGLTPLIPEGKEVEKAPKSEPASAQKEVSRQPSSSEVPFNLHLRDNIYTVNKERESNTFVQYFCNICGKDATNTRYHNLRIKTYTHNASSTINNSSVLCLLCYEQGLFPSNFKSTDFIKLQHQHEAKKWTEQEILLLLEGIEMFLDANNTTLHANANNQWEKISEHVGSKTKEQCLTKFVQLPIEEKYLNHLSAPKKVAKKGLDESLVSRVVEKLIHEEAGKKLLADNAGHNVAQAQEAQANLVNQIVELTVSRVNHKLERVDALQQSLLQLEHQLQLERKQVLVERWLQFEKVQKLKETRPELADVLDELATPVKISEVAGMFSTLTVEEHQKEADPQPMDEDKTPVSVTDPKAYLFWSG